MKQSKFVLAGAAALSVHSIAPLARAADVTCYVDGAAGDDTRPGTSEADAVKSPSKVPTSCTVVKFKRGSSFDVPYGQDIMGHEGQSFSSKIKTYTNYGDPALALPRFVKARSPNSGGMLAVYQGGVTIDGLSLAGSQSDADMANLAKGIGVMLGADSVLTNSEIYDCDIGIMTSGDGVKVLNNYIHDLHISVDAAPGVDPNVVGGAEGIFVNSSNVEVAYNTFVNCSSTAAWTGGDCDGGATEVTATNGKSVHDVRIHHNFAYNTCGFFEVSTTFQQAGGSFTKGLFADSAFYNNVMIDSGWISLLQVNNTDLSNVRWENNTIVHHKGSTNAGIMAVVYTSTSSGTSGGALQPNTVFWTNNLWVFDGVMALDPDPNFVQDHNLVIKNPTLPIFKSMSGSTNATDFDLVAGSPAIDQGVVIPDVALDFLNRAVPDPTSNQPDVGAFEYNSPEMAPPGQSVPVGAAGSGGTVAAGGAPALGGGGGSGGPPASGGTGAVEPERGGTGGKLGAGGAVASAGTAQTSSGAPSANGGATPAPGVGGDSSAAGGPRTNAGPAHDPSTTAGEPRGESTLDGSCGCRIAGSDAPAGLALAPWGLLVLAFRRRRALGRSTS